MKEEVLKNINRLKKYNMYGKYGLYEALDFTPERLGVNKKYEVVKNIYNKVKELTEKFEVKGYPTIIIFKDGTEVKRLTGLQQKPALIKALEELL